MIDTTAGYADRIQAGLEDKNDTSVNRCTWSKKHTRCNGLAHRITFEGTPIHEMGSYIEREIFTTHLKYWGTTWENTYVGDLLSRCHPHALYATSTSDEAWKEVPEEYYTSIILISSKLAIIHTRASAACWTAWLTAQEEADPPHKITRTNWKTSTMGGKVWAIPNTITAQRQQWLTGKTTETPDDAAYSQLVIHLADHQETTKEIMGHKITRLIQKHDPDAKWEDSKTGGVEHQVQPTSNAQGGWSGSFIYSAPTHALALSAQTELNNICLTTEFCRTRPTTEIQKDPRHMIAPPNDPQTKNVKEGRYSGPLSSYQ